MAKSTKKGSVAKKTPKKTSKKTSKKTVAKKATSKEVVLEKPKFEAKKVNPEEREVRMLRRLYKQFQLPALKKALDLAEAKLLGRSEISTE